MPRSVRGDRAAAKARIVELMFGGAASGATRCRWLARPPARSGDRWLLSLRSVAASDDRGATALHDLSLDLHAGEIVGIAGVDGNGQSELAEVIAGQRRPAAGRVLMGGQELTGKGVRAAARAGIGYVTDDRLGEGCVASGSVALNVVLKRIGRRPFSRRGRLDRAAIEREARAADRASSTSERRARRLRSASSPAATSRKSSWPGSWRRTDRAGLQQADERSRPQDGALRPDDAAAPGRRRQAPSSSSRPSSTRSWRSAIGSACSTEGASSACSSGRRPTRRRSVA